MANDFVDALQSAMALPSLDDVQGSDLPPLFSRPKDKRPGGVETIEEPDPNLKGQKEGIAGLTRVPFRVRRAVFTICRAGEEDPVEMARYEEIVNKCLEGKALLSPETEKVLEDGTVIVSLKWFEPIDKPATPKPMDMSQSSEGDTGVLGIGPTRG